MSVFSIEYFALSKLPLALMWFRISIFLVFEETVTYELTYRPTVLFFSEAQCSYSKRILSLKNY